MARGMQRLCCLEGVGVALLADLVGDGMALSSLLPLLSPICQMSVERAAVAATSPPGAISQVSSACTLASRRMNNHCKLHFECFLARTPP